KGYERRRHQPKALARHALPDVSEIDLERQETERERGQGDLHEGEQASARAAPRIGDGSRLRGVGGEICSAVPVVHCTASPTSRASGAQNACSSATNLATAAGSRSSVESANLSKCERIFGVRLMRRISVLSLPTMSTGRFFGPASQNQVSPR